MRSDRARRELSLGLGGMACHQYKSEDVMIARAYKASTELEYTGYMSEIRECSKRHNMRGTYASLPGCLARRISGCPGTLVPIS